MDEEVQLKRRRSSGGGMGVLAVMVALLFIVAPIASKLVTGVSQMILVGFGVLLLLLGSCIITVTRLYVKTSADEAFVRTGMGGPKAIVDGGALVIPVVHNVTWVRLSTIRFEVERSSDQALITGDKLRANVKAEFFVHVRKSEDDVKAAAASLGIRLENDRLVQEIVFDKLVSALRNVAATKPLNELHTNRDEFRGAVQEIVGKELTHNGLTLEDVTISHLDQTPTDALKPDTNVFDAEGVRKIAETVQEQRVMRNRIERDADKQVKEQDVETDRFVYAQEVARATAEATRNSDIKKAQSEALQQSATFAAQQEQLIGVAEVTKTQTVQIAEVERAKQIEVANQDREQAVQTAVIGKERALEIAGREKQIAIAGQELKRAKAETEALAAEADRETSEQAVETVKVTQTAEREKREAIIRQEAETERTRLTQNMQADVKAYAIIKESDAQLQAADKGAAAKIKLAQADRDAKVFDAEGQKAVQMVPVNVDREQVNVEEARVAVSRQDLANKAEFETIARDLQVQMAQISAEKEVRISFANAMGQALASSKMTIWGDPETVARMSQAFISGQKNGQFVDGLLESIPDEIKSLTLDGIGGAGRLLAAAVEKVTGQRIEPAIIEKVVAEALSHTGKGALKE